MGNKGRPCQCCMDPQNTKTFFNSKIIHLLPAGHNIQKWKPYLRSIFYVVYANLSSLGYVNLFAFPFKTQEREAKAEMRRKAKELQQARRDAERQGKKTSGFGGFGSGGISSNSAASMITDTIIEPEKPKMTPTVMRWVTTYWCSMWSN